MTAESLASRVALWGGADSPRFDRLRAALAEAGYEPLPVLGSDAAGAAAMAGPCGIWVYLAAERGDGLQPDLEDMRRVLGEWSRAGHPLLVVVGSAAIWEPNWHHPGLADEGAPKTVRTRNPIARRWRELEAIVDRQGPAAGDRVIVLRPAATVAPGGADFWSRLLSRRFAAVVAGHDPPLQLLSSGDLARAVLKAIRHDMRGAFHLAPSDAIPLRRLLRLGGVTGIPLPWWLLALVRHAGCRLGLSWPAAQLDYLRYSWTVSGDRFRAGCGFVVRPTAVTAAQAGRRRAADAAVAASKGADPFGMDRAFIDTCSRTVFRALERGYWRIESRGFEHVPRSGPVVLVGVHRGFMPFDAVMALHLLATRTGRYPRFLIHPGLLKFPFLHDFFLRLGGVIACRENGDRLLSAGEMVGVLPEGVHGPFRLYRDSYRLGRPWRNDFVRLALRHRAPILPWVTVGSAEAFPIVRRLDWRWWKRWAEWPFLPITATLLPVPLPSKWHTLFLPPIDVAGLHPASAADDRELVEEVGGEVRSRLGAAVAEILAARPSAFFGSAFSKE